MDSFLESQTEYLCNNLLDGAPNSILLYGEPELSLSILRIVYDTVKTRQEYRCSWHDASTITTAMQFFGPILRSKYGSSYRCLKREPTIKQCIARSEAGDFEFLARLCGKEERSKVQCARKMPLIFIDGIEDLLFRIDYGHINKEEQKKIPSSAIFDGSFRSKGFGDALRGRLHQEKRAVFYGIVRNPDSLPYECTLGDYHYLFYSENFMKIRLKSEHQEFSSKY